MHRVEPAQQFIGRADQKSVSGSRVCDKDVAQQKFGCRVDAWSGWLSLGAAMDKTIARLNIEHFRALLATKIDASKRQLVLQLLAEEEAKLAQLDALVEKEETA